MDNEKNNPEQPEPSKETRADRTEALILAEQHGEILLRGLAMYMAELLSVGIIVPQLADVGMLLLATNKALSKFADGTLTEIANDLSASPVPLAPPTDGDFSIN